MIQLNALIMEYGLSKECIVADQPCISPDNLNPVPYIVIQFNQPTTIKSIGLKTTLSAPITKLTITGKEYTIPKSTRSSGYSFWYLLPV